MKRVIKYGAAWCNMCKQQDKEFEVHPLNCRLDKVDVDTLSDEDVDSLNLRSLPVTVLWEEEDDVWEELKRWVGYVKSEEINKLL